MTTDPRPLLLITTGDPAGIGPEISLRAACLPRVRAATRLVLVGDRAVMEHAAGWSALDMPLRFGSLDELAVPAAEPTIDVLDVGALAAPVPLGVASAEGGRACHAYIQRAIDLCLAGRAHGVVTAPINKKALQMAGIDFPGHTEIFGARTAAPAFAMMMYAERMAVGLVTCHQSLASVPASLDAARIVEVGRLLHDALRRIRGQQSPRIAVLGLNPHAGEAGMFGDEEARIVEPAVARLCAMGINAEGPLPPDTAFTARALETYDGHLCLYHDQGLIPFKMLCFDTGVNVTMGLPFPRTSVDHGTAYDLAGRGTAAITSMESAIALCARLALDSA